MWDEFSEYLAGVQRFRRREPLCACENEAQRRGWLDEASHDHNTFDEPGYLESRCPYLF
ncbi:MAG: hypothetical protein KatS3mg051_1027 [Anaerolineae bacterium]|nr:MAG: hypothetical protein KatS3mg051_1027 [Anaerolineae bacterium]